MIKKSRWLLPTNTENLRMIIAQGLISTPSGFSDYYIDALKLFDGYIPFFKNEVQADVLKYVCSEEDGLTSCILECNLNILSGTCKAIVQGKVISDDINILIKKDIDILLIPAPLPLSCIKNIIFETKDSIKNFEKDAILYSNVPLQNMNLSSKVSDQKLFKTKKKMGIDYEIDTLLDMNISTDIDLDYQKVYAYGGMMANLFYFSKNGQKSHDAFMNCIIVNTKDEMKDFSFILDNLYSNELIKYPELYNSLLNTALYKKDFKEGVIEFLELAAPNIAEKMKSFEQGSDKPISEEFKDAKTMFGKILLMLFIREDSDSLIDYHLEVFSEEDFVNFAILFGIRDKFIKVPKFIKEFKNLQTFISIQMAEYAHILLDNNNIKFNFKSNNVTTIFDMLKSNRFKEYIAKELEIETCFQTIIAKSNYTVINGQPIFSGIVMPKFKLLEDNYFKSISKIKLTNYNKYIEKYLKIK